jgi:hypothetical protein
MMHVLYLGMVLVVAALLAALPGSFQAFTGISTMASSKK